LTKTISLKQENLEATSTVQEARDLLKELLAHCEDGRWARALESTHKAKLLVDQIEVGIVAQTLILCVSFIEEKTHSIPQAQLSNATFERLSKKQSQCPQGEQSKADQNRFLAVFVIREDVMDPHRKAMTFNSILTNACSLGNQRRSSRSRQTLLPSWKSWGTKSRMETL